MFECSEQLLFSCMCKLKSNCLSCYLSHVIFHISHVKFQRSNAYFDPWYMLINFCFHFYAQKSLFIAENCNVFWDLISHSITLTLSHSLSLSHSHSFSLSHSFNLSFNHSRHAEQLLFSCLDSKVTAYS